MHWHCATPLWLHAECARDLALNLLFDSERAQRLGEGQSPIAGIDRGLYAARHSFKDKPGGNHE